MQKNVSSFFPSIIPKRQEFPLFSPTGCTGKIEKLYFSANKRQFRHHVRLSRICYSNIILKLFFIQQHISQNQKRAQKALFSDHFFFLNRPLMSNPRFSSLSSSAVSEINSIYLPVPMATQLTASSATMAWMPVFCWISLSRP